MQRVTQLGHSLQRGGMAPKMSETTLLFQVQHHSIHEWLMNEDCKALSPPAAACMGRMRSFETGRL